LYNDKFYSIPSKINILDVTLEQAIEIIEEHNKKLEKNTVKKFDDNPDVKIVKGRRGMLQIYYKNKYYRIPKGIDIDKLTADEAIKIAKEQEKNSKK
jgi:DNA topoisomerase-1